MKSYQQVFITDANSCRAGDYRSIPDLSEEAFPAGSSEFRAPCGNSRRMEIGAGFGRSLCLRKAALALFALITLSVLSLTPVKAAEQRLQVLCTTFPVYQISRNLTLGVKGVELDLMVPAQLGCPHNYAMTPGDARKIAEADIIVINGLGMEGFLEDRLDSINPGVEVVDSSSGIEEVLEFGEPDSDHSEGNLQDKDSESGDHHHHALNAHLFASPRMAALMALNISDRLSRLVPAEAELVRENGRLYSERLADLAGEFEELVEGLENNRIVTQHGAFDYLARDTGLEIVATINSEGGDTLSAAGLIGLVRTIREAGVGALFTEPQYPARIGRTIASEAGIPFGELDPVASGPEKAPLDYYESVMRKNMRTLDELLGAVR